MLNRFLAAILLAVVCLTSIAPRSPALAAVRASICDTNVDVSASTATTANLAPIPRQGTQRVHVCAFSIAVGPMNLGAFEVVSIAGGVGDVLVVPPGQALCLTTTTTAIVGGNMMIATY
jgi:hypothetical protein